MTRGFLLADRSSSSATVGRHGDALAQQLVTEARHHTVVEVVSDVAQVGRGALTSVGSLPELVRVVAPVLSEGAPRVA